MISSSRSALLTFTVVLVLAALAQAQTFTTLYTFTGGSDGGNPWAGVIQDAAGNLYGTAYYGGYMGCSDGEGYGCGVMYKLDTAGTETVLRRFYGRHGEFPNAAVTRDKTGNMYGTTNQGGSHGWQGTVFKIDTAGNETVLYNFAGGSDGCLPFQGLVRDKAGNLYGTAGQCGASGYGTIFKVDSAENFAVLHSFTGAASDGAHPYHGHLTIDQFGDLYGVTANGGFGKCHLNGNYGCGVLYKLSKSGRVTLLHSFKGGIADGCYPFGTVVRDEAGNFYGTTLACGSYGNGTIWRVSKKGKETILHNFAGGTSDGCSPDIGVTRDSHGNLYGGADCGANGNGALYELSAKRKLTLLHSFDNTDGASPYGEVLRTSKGALFGTTAYGAYGYGTVWKYVP